MLRRTGFALCFLLAALTGASAREQVPAEERIYPYSGLKTPGCDDPAVLSRLASRFAEKESTYWQSSLEIVAVRQIRTVAFRPNGLDLIPRRYCRGVAELSNHRVSPVWYVLTEEAGMAGHSFGIQFCVAAYDRQWAYAPECKMAQP